MPSSNSARELLFLAGIASLVIIGALIALKVVNAGISLVITLATVVGWFNSTREDCQKLARFFNLYPRNQTEAEEYTLEQIRRATNNGAHLIGQGVSGMVYGGRLDGRMVAVMRLEGGRRRARYTFTRLQPLRHDHIARLVGSCTEGEHRILVYELIANTRSTLGRRLHSIACWKRRFEVLLGAARAIEYLHSEAVIHGNLTSANILLDRNLRPRVFGFGGTSDRRPSGFVQTEGYRDPEYVRTRRLKPATDVYSLGVVMLEVLTGQPPVRANHATLVSWALPSIQAGQLNDVLDMRPTSMPNWRQRQALWMVAWTAASCLCSDGYSRRAISHVVRELVEAHTFICNDR